MYIYLKKKGPYGSWIYNYMSKVESLNPVHGQVYPIQHCLSVSGFLRFSPVASTNKTEHHDITEILLKVALSTINLTKPKIK